MTRKLRFNILAFIVLCLGLTIIPQTSYCQQTEIVVSNDSASFNAIEYLLIPRYKNPDRHIFEKNRVGGHWSAGIYTDQPLSFIAPNRNSYTAEMNFHWGVFAGKQFDSYNTLRIQYDFGKLRFSGTPSALAKRHQIGVDYLWNMSNYFYGYDEARSWSLSYVLGLNLGKTYEGNNSSRFGGAHTGIQLRGDLSPRTFIFVEPQLAVYASDMNIFRGNDWRSIEFASNTLVGIGARLSTPYRGLQWERNISSDSISLLDNYFIQFSLGAFDRLTDVQGKTTEWGPNFQVSMGRWINPKLALRASLYAGQLNSLQQNKRVGAMMEGVLSIPKTFDFSLGRFGLDVSAGLRYDLISRINGFWGTTSALQLKYFVNQQFSLFSEGRYSAMYNNLISDYEPYANLNLGVELYRTNFDRYNAKKMTMGNVLYRTQYFASLGYGQIYPFLLGGDWISTLNSTYNWALGYRFDFLNAIRIKGDFVEFQPKSNQSMHRWTTLSPQYMFSISNWWMDNTTHSFDMHPYIGPVLSLTEAEYFGHGIEAGIPIAWKLLSGLELFVEPSYRYTFSNSLRKDGYNKGMLSISGGLSYIQGPIYFSEYFKQFNWGNDWFVACFGGLQQDLSSVGYGGITTLPVGNLAIGRWLGPLGIRLSGFGSLNRKLADTQDYLMTMAYAGARAEGMVNLTSLFAPSKELKDFELDFLTGYYGSLVYRPLKMYTRNWAYADGPTAALQFKYYVMDGIGLFIEPRYTKVGYKRIQRKEYGGETIKMSQTIADISIGMEVRQHSIMRGELKNSYAGFAPRTFVSGDLGFEFPLHYNSGKPISSLLKCMSPQATFSIGREFNAINALRGGITLASLQSQFSDNHESGFAVSADYMLSLTNGMLGYDPWRVVDIKAIVGVNALYSSYQDKTNIGFHGGAQVGLHATDYVDIYAEGKVAAYHKPSIIKGMRTVRNVGLVPTASLGATYYFNATTSSLSNLLRSQHLENWFIDVYGGPQYDTSIYNTNVGQKFGFVGSLAIGKMYGILGWRMGGFLSLNRAWKGTHPEMMAYGGVRVEGMVDLFNLVNPQEKVRPFTVNVLGGFQPGIVYRPYNHGKYTRNWAWTFGPTTALQFVWQFERIGLFAEPRYTWQNFNREYRNTEDGKYAHFRHKHFEFNVGLRIRQSTQMVSNSDYTPNMFVSVEGGAVYPLHYKGSNGANGIFSHIGSQWCVGVGRRFSALSSVRARVDYQNLQSQFVDNVFYGCRLGVDYMGSISNLMWGYDKQRMIDLYGFVGINSLYTDYKNRVNWGIGCGFNANIRLYGDMKLHVEPRCDLYRRPDIIPGLRTIRYTGIVPSFSAGITYEF